MGCDKNSSQREVYSNSVSPQETKLSNEQSTLTDKATRERDSKDIKKETELVEGKTSSRSKLK